MPYTKVYISIIAWLDRLTQVSVMNIFSVFICLIWLYFNAPQSLLVLL